MISRMSVYRAKKNPHSCKAMTLYEIAEAEKTTIEEILGKRLYIAGIACDGFITQDGFVYAYKKGKSPLNSPRLLFVYKLDGKLYVGKRKQMRAYDEIIGTVTLRMEIMDTGGL